MSRIVIDGRMIHWTGVGRYTRELIAHLSKIDSQNQYIVLLAPDQFEQWQPPSPRWQKLKTNALPYKLSEQLLAFKLYRLRADLVHFVTPNQPILYFGRHVTTIHDLTLLNFKNVRESKLRYAFRQAAFRFVLWCAVRSSAAIIAPTNYVADQLRSRYHLPKQRVTATWEGVSLTSTTKPQPYPVEAPYLLHVGNFYPYKNLMRLAQATADLAASRKNAADLKLVLVGPPGYFQQRFEQELKDRRLADRVVFTGFAPDSQLAWLYQHAELVAIPSLSEGFGLPGLEAMQQGAPVAAAEASCLPEVYGEAAVYFDPLDVNDMTQVIGDLLDDKTKRQQLVKAGGQRVKLFSWSKMSEQTLELYQKLLAGTR